MATRQIDPAETIAAILGGEEPYPAAVIKPTGIAGIDLLPGSKRATSFNVPDPHLADPARQFSLRQFLDEVKEAYDLRAHRLPAEPAPLLLGGPGRERPPDRARSSPRTTGPRGSSTSRSRSTWCSPGRTRA